MVEPESEDTARWTDERLAALKPPDGWIPNEARGLARLDALRGKSPVVRRRGMWLAVAAATVALGVIPSPHLRGFAQACGEFVLRAWPGSGLGHTYDAGTGRRAFADLTLRDLDGQAVRLSEYAGKVVLVTFWSTTCGQCESEMPWFSEFRQKYSDQGFDVVGVAVDQRESPPIKQYVASRPINYRVVLGDSAETRREATSIPTTVIVDRSGRIAVRHVGYCSKREFESDIQAVLAER
jgi:peroxiredoxin